MAFCALVIVLVINLLTFTHYPGLYLHLRCIIVIAQIQKHPSRCVSCPSLVIVSVALTFELEGLCAKQSEDGGNLDHCV